MNNLLKHDADRQTYVVRPINWTALDARAAGEDTVDPEVAALAAEVARLELELSQAAARLAQECAAAREEGRLAAEQAYKRSDDEQLAALRSGIEAAIEAATPHLASVERIALACAETALAAVLDDAAAYHDQIVQVIRRQVAALNHHTVLAAVVSRADFPEDAALTVLSNSIGAEGLDIRVSADLPAGCARFGLSLGDVEIDIPRHWAEIKQVLTDLAQAEPADGA